MDELAVQICIDEREIKVKSLLVGFCQVCGLPVICPNDKRCFHAKNYDESNDSNIALEEGVCRSCGGKVDCEHGHLGSGRNQASLAEIAIRVMLELLAANSCRRSKKIKSAMRFTPARKAHQPWERWNHGENVITKR